MPACAGCAADDVLLVVRPAVGRGRATVLERAPVWGLTTVWIGAGRVRAPGAADHVLWVDDDGPAGAATTAA